MTYGIGFAVWSRRTTL